jgi:hypothetical protein
VEPVLWQRIRLAHPKSVSGAASTLSTSFGRNVKAGLWIKHLKIMQSAVGRLLSDSNLLDHILFILSQASNLTALDVMPQIQHSSVISLLPITCMHSLSCLNLSIMPEATNAINFLDELKSLVSLGIEFYGHGFRLPAPCKPWNLMHLKTITWWTSQNIDNQSSNYLTECSLPVIQCLELQVGVIDAEVADSILRLYESKRSTLKKFYVCMNDTSYAMVIPRLDGIEKLVVEAPSARLVAMLPSSMSDLYLRFETERVMRDVYSILDEILCHRTRSDRIIHVQVLTRAFFWMSDDPQTCIGDGTIPYGDFTRKLLQYTMKGLKILDDNDKSPLDYIPWR